MKSIGGLDMGKMKLLLGASILLLTSAFTNHVFADSGKPFQEMQSQIDGLQDQINKIELIPGPAGPPGFDGSCTVQDYSYLLAFRCHVRSGHGRSTGSSAFTRD